MELKSILEALLFSSQKPLSSRELREILAAAPSVQDPDDAEVQERVQERAKVSEEDSENALRQLEEEWESGRRSFRLVCVAGAWQFVNRSEYAPWIRALVGERNRPSRLSQPALETLAIIAYRQPITRAEMEQIRGVSVDGVIQTLTERGLVEPTGRSDAAGRPMTYGTTSAFLEYFGLRTLNDLPAADELRRIEVPASAPITPELGLAAAPPENLSDPPVPAGESGETEDRREPAESDPAPDEEPSEGGDENSLEQA